MKKAAVNSGELQQPMVGLVEIIYWGCDTKDEGIEF